MSDASRIRVLLISDLLLVRAGLRCLLEASDITPSGEAATCLEALALVKNDRPDVILIDIDSRAETFTCVEDLVAAEGRRILVLSDRTRASDHPALVELGAIGLVLKHEPPEVLIKAIQKVHAGEVWIDRSSMADALQLIARRRNAEDADAGKIAALTKREREIIALVGDGMKNKAIAERLVISEATARNHLTSILEKLDLSDRFELAVYAFKHGLVLYPDAQKYPRLPRG